MKKIDKIVTGVIFGVIGALCIGGGISSHYDKINSNKIIEQRDIFIDNNLSKFDNICLESDDYLYTIKSDNSIEFKDGEAYARFSVVNDAGQEDKHPFMLEYVKQSDGSYKCQNEKQVVDKLDDLKNNIETKIKENKKREAESKLRMNLKFVCEAQVMSEYLKINESFMTDVRDNGLCNYVIRGTIKGIPHNYIFTFKVNSDMSYELTDYIQN